MTFDDVIAVLCQAEAQVQQEFILQWTLSNNNRNGGIPILLLGQCRVEIQPTPQLRKDDLPDSMPRERDANEGPPI